MNFNFRAIGRILNLFEVNNQKFKLSVALERSKVTSITFKGQLLFPTGGHKMLVISEPHSQRTNNK